MVLLIRALQPVVLVRFRSLRSKAFGHFACNPELYLCERDLGITKEGYYGERSQHSRTFDIFYMPQPVSNQQLEKMWRRVLRVSRLAGELLRVNRWFPGYETHVIPKPWFMDTRNLLARAPVHLSFTGEEEQAGQLALGNMGIPEDVPFVCFHARDPAYLDATFLDKYGGLHDHRDSSISNYMDAAEWLTGRGYFAIRMGAIVAEALRTSNPMIIDYATRFRTDFLDIFLLAKCRFFVADTAGIANVAMIFRRPVAYVNWIPLNFTPTWSPKDLFIPKKLWLRDEQRFMTFHEIINTRVDGSPSLVGLLEEAKNYEQLGIDVIENTAEEVTALTVEMDERLKGTWQPAEEDEELQQRFWSVFKQGEWFNEYHREVLSRIGADFLRKNQELLN